MVASIANDVYATQISYRTQHRVRTVQQGHLALVIRFLALGDQHVQTGLVSRELSLQLIDTHVLRFLDYPEVEDLGLYNEVVVVAYFLLNSSDILAREARNDTVHERCAHIVVFLEPLLECLIICAEVIFPQLNVLADTVLEVVSVQEDQLARHKDQTLCRIAVEGLETTEQQLNQLTRI